MLMLAVHFAEIAVNKVLVVAITSNRGFVVPSIQILLNRCATLTQEIYVGKQVDFMAIGKKANDILGKKATIVANHSEVFDDLTFDNVAVIAEDLMELFTNGSYDRIDLVYNKFKNAATQIVMSEQFLPIVPMEGMRVQIPITFLNLQKQRLLSN